jgi:hypothetical protein
MVAVVTPMKVKEEVKVVSVVMTATIMIIMTVVMA